ncbi:MAG: Hpt domain-containing protein, partial [Myxococcota bacterium]
MSKYKILFIEESREHLTELSRLLVALEASDEPGPLVDEVFRHTHSVKGMAASMGLDPIVRLAHRMEDVVGERRQSKARFGAAIIDLLLRGVDALTDQVDCFAGDSDIKGIKGINGIHGHDDLVAALEKATGTDEKEPEEAPSPSASPAPVGVRTVLVDLDETCKAPAVRLFLVHKCLAEFGDISASMPTIDAMRKGRVTELRARFDFASAANDDVIRTALLAVSEVASVAFESVAAAPAGPRPEANADGAKASVTVRVRTDILDTLIDNVGELFILRQRLESLVSDQAQAELRSALDALSVQIREVHNQVMAVRMTPMHTLTDRFPRLVRDLAR